MRVLCDAYLVNEKAVLSSYRDQAQTGKLVIGKRGYIETESVRPVVRARCARENVVTHLQR